MRPGRQLWTWRERDKGETSGGTRVREAKGTASSNMNTHGARVYVRRGLAEAVLTEYSWLYSCVGGR